MPHAKMHMHLFRVNVARGSDTLPDLLARISSTRVEDRSRSAFGTNYRAEIVDDRGDAWVLNFVKFRDSHGPGKVSRRTPLEGFDLGTGDYFGEDSAALFFPQRRYMVLQYNHSGPRHSAIAEYLSAFRTDRTNTYSLDVKLDVNTERVFRRRRTSVRTFEVGIDMTGMTAADRGALTSLGEASTFAHNLNGNRLELVVSIGPGRRGQSLSDRAKDFLSDLLSGPQKDAVYKARAAIKRSDDSPTEVIDLIDQKLTSTQLVVVGPGLRLSLADRVNALRVASTRWATVMGN